jgi:hypothetical protein
MVLRVIVQLVKRRSCENVDHPVVRVVYINSELGAKPFEPVRMWTIYHS